MENKSVTPISTQDESHPPLIGWTISDTWIGIGITVLAIGAIIFATQYFDVPKGFEAFSIVGTELMLLIPILLIFTWRKIPLKALGFRKFNWNMVSLGCGLVVLAYGVIFIHNLIMTQLGVVTQGELIFEVFDKLGSPFLLFFSGIILAPLAEEMFFRGFLFQGFRQKYGWKIGIFLSSFLFALMHGQLAALIPTFLLGCIIAYIYHRANSILPGMLIHFIINAWGLLGAYAAYKLNLI